MTSLSLLLLLLQIWLVSSWTPVVQPGGPMFSTKQLNHTDDTIQNGFSGREAYFSQKLDHFNNNSNATWMQRYFYNLRYYRPGTNAVFLMLGGAGVQDIMWVQNEDFPFVQWAKEERAPVFALEHRFYGKSLPTNNLSVENLQLLNSRQAIEDVATFIQKMNKKHHFKDPKWIVFGGSYGGSLALWTRQKYPNLTAGAVGSSPLLQPKVDFWEATQFVEETYRSYNPKCADNIEIAFAQILDMMGTELGRDQLSELFRLKPPLSNRTLKYEDIQLLTSIQLNNFILGAQFRGGPLMQQGGRSFSLYVMCDFMNDEFSDQITSVGAIDFAMFIQSKYVMDVHPNTPSSYDDMIKYLRRESFDEDEYGLIDRAWMWQRCTEFGSFPTTDGGINSMFGSLVSLSFHINTCRDVFGKEFDAEHIEKSIRSTIEHYGGADGYKGTNVVIANGGRDPWSLLSKLTSEDPSVVSYVVKDSSHCDDMFPPLPQGYPPEMKVLHQLIAQNIDNWISGSPSPFYHEHQEPKKPWIRPELKHPLEGLKSAFKPTRQHSSVVNTASTSQMPPAESIILRKVHLGRPPHGFLPEPNMPSSTPESFESGFFEQPVDHFDNQNPYTFNQKYFKNDQWARPGGPIFLKIGGESPARPSWVLNGNLTYLKWAENFGATVYHVEHRYYGDSHLFGAGDAFKNKAYLSYLSSLQMLYDVANFIRTVNIEMNLTEPAKWILFGGSYSGSLALWMRELFPGLVHGAVGSSAPLEAKLDFYEYLQVVEASIRNHSEKCVDTIAKGFEEIHQLMLTGAGRQELSKTFKLNPPWDDVSDVFEIDKQFFFASLIEQFAGAVQYSGDNTRGYASGHGIPDMCRIMAKPGKPISNIADFNEYMTIFYQGGGQFNYTFNSYKHFINVLRESMYYKDESASVLWTWQTCTEFGFYQTTDSGYSIFGIPLPLDFFTQMCSDLFGKGIPYSAKYNQQAVQKINRQYGGRHNFKGTNMVMTHGSLDPWHALRNETCDSSNNCFLIQGTAHCADMYPAREQDPQALVDTRKNIEKILEKWLAPPAPTDAPAEKWTGFPNNIVWSSPPVPVEVNTEDASHSINYDSSRKKATTSNSAGTMAFTELVILFITMALFIRQALVH